MKTDIPLQERVWLWVAQLSARQQRQWIWRFVFSTIGVITLLHYLTNLQLLPYHAIYRSLYYVPVAVAAVISGFRGGVSTAIFVSLVYLPHAMVLHDQQVNLLVDTILEIITLLTVAALVGVLADAERYQRQQTEHLRHYISDILTCLPVGVSTLEDSTLTHRNPVAIKLLAKIDPMALPATSGYHELLVDTQPLGIYRSILRPVDGSQNGYVLVAEDLSERYALAQQVRQNQRMIALGQLAGGLAHEVRNPLSIIRATAQLLQAKTAHAPELSTYTGILTSESDRIERLISDLLHYAHPRPLLPQQFDLVTLLGEFKQACLPLVEQYGIALELDVPPTLTMIADWEYLWQALLNVVLNAFQASVPGQTVMLQADGQHDILLAVHDQGKGIPQHVREHLFDPFFTTRDDGVGLGLAVVARIIAEHHGTIKIISPPDGGTSVCFHFPRELQGRH